MNCAKINNSWDFKLLNFNKLTIMRQTSKTYKIYTHKSANGMISFRKIGRN